MHLVVVGLGLYILFSEWRNMKQNIRLKDLEQNLSKFKKDKTIWYSGVLPASDKLCLFQENSGEYVISKLEDKRWMKKDGETDFSKIKRWVYLDDLKNL